MDEAVTKLNLKNEINAYITQLCKNVINLLESGNILVADRTALVEKCLVFYNRLLDFKHAGKCMVIHSALYNKAASYLGCVGGSPLTRPGYEAKNIVA